MNNEMITVSKEALDRIVSEAVNNVLALNLENGIRHTQNELPLTVTIEEAARLLNISLPTAYELARKQNFPSFRIGKKILISRSGLQAWIDELCQGD